MVAEIESSDSELLAGYRAGEPGAFALIYDRFEMPVFRYLLGVLRDRAAAEDALQDTFVLAFRKSDSARVESFRGWLFAVAHQQAMLFKRRAKRWPEAISGERLLSILDFESDPARTAQSADSSRIAMGMLESLPESQRSVIRLRIFEGLKFRDVAERLGCPLNTALARMHDGLRNLRLLWEKAHDES